MKIFKILICSLTLFFLTSGCFKTYQELVIKSDLSGSVSFKISYDMESLLSAIAKAQGAGDDPDMENTLKETLRPEIESKLKVPNKKDMGEKLPKGIKLASCEMNEKESKREVFIKFDFDHIDRIKELQSVKLFKNIPQEAGGIAIPIKDPLQQIKDVEIKAEGDKLVISQKITSLEMLQNKELKESVPGADQIIESALQNMGLFFRIKVPANYTVVKHNAPKYEKDTLLWSYNNAKIQEFVKSGKSPDDIYVELKKKSSGKK